MYQVNSGQVECKAAEKRATSQINWGDVPTLLGPIDEAGIPTKFTESI